MAKRNVLRPVLVSSASNAKRIQTALPPILGHRQAACANCIADRRTNANDVVSARLQAACRTDRQSCLGCRDADMYIRRCALENRALTKSQGMPVVQCRVTLVSVSKGCWGTVKCTSDNTITLISFTDLGTRLGDRIVGRVIVRQWQRDTTLRSTPARAAMDISV